MLDGIFCNSEKVVGREIAGEQLLVPATEGGGITEYIYCLNPTAAWIWQQLDGTHKVQQILDAFVAEFEVEKTIAEADLLQYLKELQDMSLIELVHKEGENAT